jgi:hypothetical protein
MAWESALFVADGPIISFNVTRAAHIANFGRAYLPSRRPVFWAIHVEPSDADGRLELFRAGPSLAAFLLSPSIFVLSARKAAVPSMTAGAMAVRRACSAARGAPSSLPDRVTHVSEG